MQWDFPTATGRAHIFGTPDYFETSQQQMVFPEGSIMCNILTSFSSLGERAKETSSVAKSTAYDTLSFMTTSFRVPS
jgi:hypothetical protein